jgi:amino-acid N-acetyltransferase
MAEHYIRKARVQDVRVIHALLMDCASEGLLLPRSLSELYKHLRDFYVVVPVNGGEPVGCCALSIIWDNVAEIRSLAVNPEAKKKKWGSKLVETCLSEAITLGIFRVFTLTYVPDFFRRFGFSEAAKEILPQKVWADCLNCPKFPDCDEIAMILDLERED